MGDSGTPSAFTKPYTPTYPPVPLEFDASDYPPVPFSGYDVPYDVYEAWEVASTHGGTIDAIMDGWWPCCRELTTGAGRPCPALAWWGEPQPPVPPCTCLYALHPVIWYPTHLIDVPGVGQRGAAYTFRIDPWCPHHGAEDEFGRMPAADLVLDEDERRGH